MTIPTETRPSETHVGDTHVGEAPSSFVSYTKTSFRSGHIVVPGSRERFGWSHPADPKRLRQLEQENAKLRRLLAARDLEIEVIRGAGRQGCVARSSVSAHCRHRRTDRS